MPSAENASRRPLERDGGYAVGALVGGLGGARSPPIELVAAREQRAVDEVVTSGLRRDPAIEHRAARARHVDPVTVRSRTSGFLRDFAATIAMCFQEPLYLGINAHPLPLGYEEAAIPTPLNPIAQPRSSLP